VKTALAITKALSDPNRIRALLMLEEQDLCVCQILEILGLAPSTVSKHLSILAHAGLIETRKEGRYIHCRLPEPGEADASAHRAIAWVKETLASDPQIAADRERLREVLEIGPVELCRRQSEKMKEECCP
jgi:ArsR family transcriptional regulator, arsenate/arsenite/antimonite-responsive transcriptional repressor